MPERDDQEVLRKLFDTVMNYPPTKPEMRCTTETTINTMSVPTAGKIPSHPKSNRKKRKTGDRKNEEAALGEAATSAPDTVEEITSEDSGEEETDMDSTVVEPTEGDSRPWENGARNRIETSCGHQTSRPSRTQRGREIRST